MKEHCFNSSNNSRGHRHNGRTRSLRNSEASTDWSASLSNVSKNCHNSLMSFKAPSKSFAPSERSADAFQRKVSDKQHECKTQLLKRRTTKVKSNSAALRSSSSSQARGADTPPASKKPALTSDAGVHAALAMSTNSDLHSPQAAATRNRKVSSGDLDIAIAWP